jgi:hypothetical protein
MRFYSIAGHNDKVNKAFDWLPIKRMALFLCSGSKKP